MKHIYLLAFLLIYTTLTQAQSNSNNIGSDFAFIESSTDTSSLKFIRAFKCISKEGDDIPSLYRAIKVQAIAFGANCFKFINFTRDSTGIMTLTLRTYYGNDTILNFNSNNHDKNMIFIFGDDKFGKRKYSFRVNNIKKKVSSGQYYSCVIKPGENVRINKGGFLGTTISIGWRAETHGRYFTMSGFGLSDRAFVSPTPYGTGGISFTTGKFKYMDSELGRLLAVILKKQE